MREDRGFALSYRRLWSHPIFRNKQEAAVFAWMIDIAQWQDAKISTKFGPITLRRGELLIAERQLADDFGLHRNTLRALIQRMLDDGMLTVIRDRSPHRAGTIVILNNYEQYQSLNSVSIERQDRRETESETLARPKEDRKRTKNKEEKEDNKDSLSIERAPDDCRAAFEGWNALAAELGLPQAKILDPRRRTGIRARMSEGGGLPGWTAALDAIRDSPFCRGDNDRGWRIDLEALLQRKTFARLVEGGYGRRQDHAAGGEVLSAVDRELSQWKGRLAMHAKDGTWLGSWGPEPGKPGCFVPRELILQPQPAGGI